MTGFIIALLAVGAVVATYLSSSETKAMVPVES